MRQLKTPEEILKNHGVFFPQMGAIDIHEMIKAAQRDALECIEEAIPEIEWPMNGYAPGTYFCECGNCKNNFIGDKLAVRCEACALAMYMDAIRENILNLMPK